MSQPVIEIKDLSKVYTISHQEKVDRNSLKETMVRALKSPKEALTGRKNPNEKFWALNKVSTTIQRGDVVGLIGKNGSGKSTLLKTLSRIVDPTEGEVVLRGNTASLLEVGTGFHPELTGRENIYFNGSILGMSRKEIEQKFDEIVAFSEIEKFLDTPVKFYSSGMYVRLAFAVAAHLEPDILIVDEVLAVGDASFQKKSLGKMRDATQNADRTVIFVSHNMDAIQSICNKCMWLNQGKLVDFGDTEKIITAYEKSTVDGGDIALNKRKDRQGTGKLRATSISTKDHIADKGRLGIRVEVNNTLGTDIKDIKFSIDIFDHMGNYVSNILNSTTSKNIDVPAEGRVIEIEIDDFCLVPGRYSLNVFLASDDNNSEIYDWVESAGNFTVSPYDFYKVGRSPVESGKTVFLNYKIKA